MKQLLTILLIVAVVGAASLAPAPVYYLDRAGSDSNDGLDADKAWKTFGKFTSSATTGDTLYAKAGTYTEQDGVSGAVFAPTSTSLTVIGYNTTTDTLDGTIGCVILDAGDESLVSGMKTNYSSTVILFSALYLRFTGGSSHGADLVANDDRVASFHGCRFDNNGGRGLYGDNYITVSDSQADNNTDRGLYLVSGGNVKNCVAYNNGHNGIRSPNATTDGCLIYENGDTQLWVSIAEQGIVTNCTIDGGGTKNGIEFGSGNQMLRVYNCIIYDCDPYGALSPASPRSLARNNLYFSNTANTDGD